MTDIQLLSADGAAYIGFAKQKLALITSLRKSQGQPKLSKIFQIDTFLITVVSSDWGDTIRIDGEGGVTGFICHPRSEIFPGGWKEGEEGIEPLDNSYVYPLEDDDGGSVVLSYDGEWETSREVENYGNIDWRGLDGEILSWRGPPSRHFALDPTENYPGFTVFDEVVGEIEYFTPFGPNVYQGGEILDTLPGAKILGACLRNGKLIVVASSNYRGMNNPAGGIGGFYDEVWEKGEDWVLLGFKQASRASTCWFFTEDGLTAYHGHEVLNLSGAVPVWSTTPDIASTAILTVASGSWGLTADGVFLPYRETDTLQVTLKAVDASLRSGNSTGSRSAISVYMFGDEPAALTVSGSDTPTIGSVYSAAGGQGTVIFSGNGITLNSSGEVTAIPGCGMGSITVTDACGATATKSVRLPSGVWVTDTDNVYYSGYGSFPSHTEIVGTQRITEWGEKFVAWHGINVVDGGPTWYAPFGCCTPCGGAVPNPQIYSAYDCADTYGYPRSTTSMISSAVWPDATPLVQNQLAGFYSCEGDHTTELVYNVTRPACVSVYRRLVEKWVCP